MKLGGIISRSKGEQTPSQRWRRIFREKCIRKQCFREITVGNCRRDVLKCRLAFCGAQDSTYSLAQAHIPPGHKAHDYLQGHLIDDCLVLCGQCAPNSEGSDQCVRNQTTKKHIAEIYPS